MRLTFTYVCLCICTVLANAQTDHLLLSVQDIESGIRLDNVLVYSMDSRFQVELTDTLGELPIERGLLSLYDSLLVSRVGYQKKVFLSSALLDKERFTVYLKAISQEEIIVRAKQIPSSFFKTNTLDQRKLNNLVFIGGETDIIRSFTSLPSVEEGKDGLANYYVRGSGQEQNEMLIDGMPLLSKTVAYDLYSTVPSSMLQEAAFFPGIFPSNFGGRLASFADLNSWRHIDSVSLDIMVSPLLPSANLKLPLFKGRVGVLANVRTFPFFIFSKNGSVEETLNNNNSTYFLGTYIHDLFSKVFWKTDRLYMGLTFMANSTRSQNGDNANFEYTSTRTSKQVQLGSFQFDYSPSETINILGTSGFTRLETEIGTSYYRGFMDGNYDSRFERLIEVDLAMLKNQLEFKYRPAHTFELSLGVDHRRYYRGTYRDTQEENEMQSIASRSDRIVDSETISLYQMTEYHKDNLSLKFGLRFDQYQAPEYAETNLLPYLSWSLSARQWKYTLGLNVSRQYEHEFLSNADLLSWNLVRQSDAAFPAEKATIFSLGANYEDRSQGLFFESTVYYKVMQDQIFYLTTPNRFSLTSLEQRIWSNGYGRSYGLEVQVNKRWANSSTSGMSIALYDAKQRFDGLNDGQLFDFKYNRGVSLSVNHSAALTERLNINVAGFYRGGYYVTFPVGFTPSDITYYSFAIYKDVNNYRLPAYHRIDVGLSKSFPKQTNKHTMALTIHNIYARKNPVNFQPYIGLDKDDNLQIQIDKRKSFTIFPAFSLLFHIL